MKKIVSLLSVVILFNRCSKAPSACFTYYPSIINAGDVVTFNADCSKNASSFKWSFGDNTKDTTLNNNNLVSHVYKTSGNFTVKLSASRKDGVTLKKGEPEKSLMIVVQ